MEKKLVSDMLIEYDQKKGFPLNIDNEDIFNVLTIAREIIDLDYLHEKKEEIASENLVASPFCVVLMLVRTIELLQEDLLTKNSEKKVMYTITADGAQLLSSEAKLEELEIVLKDITDTSLKGEEYLEYFLRNDFEKYDIVSNNIEKLEELGFYIKSTENKEQGFGVIIIW